jgi:ribonucleotide reductase beta subunit family protein with ferritin-like domain
MIKKEPLLEPDNSRFTLFPIRYDNLWKMYKEAEALFWTAEEIDLAGDITHWENLTKDEQHFIKTVLSFFSASDRILSVSI